jgi:murein DD-endopeptidase MepM/ murein hydrolase activator NlpD
MSEALEARGQPDGLDSPETIDTLDTIDGADVCGLCESPLLRKRYVQTQGSEFYVLCSKECARVVAHGLSRERWAARRRSAKRLTIGIIFAGAYLAPHQGPPGGRRVARASMVTPAKNSGQAGVAGAAAPALPPGWFGPDWPPTETNVLAALGRDAWIHPLCGPLRRMPIRDSRVFGAVRPGDRAAECRNGHCGVDLGGEIWGEQVHAVHDGVVDFVKRGINPDHGGQYVRIAHRNGTVMTLYFHLAAIPREIERGAVVKGGQVIGLLGDTGVKESGPHLHFAMTIRPAKDWPEKYIDPEPLIALWPLRVPVDGGEAGLVNTVAMPGVPLGSASLIPGRKRKGGKPGRAGEAATAGEREGPAHAGAGDAAESEDTADGETGESSTGE